VTATAFAIGAGIGAVFGIVRAMSLLPARRVRDPESLVDLHRGLATVEVYVRRATPVVELLLVAVVIGWVA